ncbi:MAG TPA: ABC transporter substrate-binding protein [Candidatus Limnocylindria bacterium]|nr:ABC transporter substrate-binding protein [Candidatus Limnocylindria bacterium]
MDDRHIERALRRGPPDEPVYQPVLGRQLAAELGRKSHVADANAPAGLGRIRVRTRPGPAFKVWQLAGSIATGLVILVALTISLRFAMPEVPPAAQDDLLNRLTAAGVVRVVVTNQPPQVLSVGGAHLGFDVQVAEELSAALALRPTISARHPDEVVATADAWDVALPSKALDLPESNFRTSHPYYAWPVWLVVAADSSVDAVEQLAGETICVVSGSVGADWLLGRAAQAVETFAARPSGVQATERDDDLGCAAALADGEANAALTAALLDDEFAAHGLRMVGAGEVLREPRSVIVAGPPQETRRLIEAIDRALSDLRSSGRLAELSQRSFGGRDLTEGTR